MLFSPPFGEEGLASQTAMSLPFHKCFMFKTRVLSGSSCGGLLKHVWTSAILCYLLVMALALPGAAVMDEDLVKLLTAPKPKGWALHEEIVAGILKNGITSIPMFAKVRGQ